MAADQRLAALVRAEEVRARRAALKRHLREGRVSLAYVLRANKRYTQTMPLQQLLLATPNVGPVKTARVLTALKIGPQTPLENISMQRREKLLAWLCDHCPRVPVDEITPEQNRVRLIQLRTTEKAKAASA